MIKFSEIKGFKDGRRASFEELVCQLARREQMPNGSEFRRVDGAGGDGGVEAYWVKPDKSKYGYQAKYFLRTGDIDWSQIDESVSQALLSHPELIRYVVALPCDLTGRSGAKRKGKTGWEHWETRVKKWAAQAAKIGNNKIKFEVWSASELIDRLSGADASGLRQYWFDGVEFTDQWFERHINQALASLGERFHPEDHVEVRIQRLFQVIARDPGFVLMLEARLEALNKSVLPDRRLLGLKKKPSKKLMNAISKSHTRLVGIADDFRLLPHTDWRKDHWESLCDDLLTAIGEMLDWVWKYDSGLSKPDDDNEIYAVHQVLSDLGLLRDTCEKFLSLIASDFLLAENKGLALVKGTAGSGKSHLFGNEVQKAVAAGRPAIIILGQRLNGDEPWSQVAKLLGLPTANAETILGALDAAGEAKKTRSLLLVDAINEGPGSKFWRQHLAAFVKQVEPYKHIACILSCRTEYYECAVPTAVADEGAVFSIRGFETPEEQLEAARVYLDRRGIARPSTPWLAPEFVNPLFLRSVCIALANEGKTEFPTGLHGTRQILSYYLDSVGQNLTAELASLSDLVQPTKKVVLQLADRMVENRCDYITLGDARSITSGVFSGFSPPANQCWLEVFLGNGTLRRDPDPESATDDPLLVPEDVVRFSFQRFQDFLMGQALLLQASTSDELFNGIGVLQFMLDGNQISWRWRGLFDALSTLVPETFEKELVDLLPGRIEVWWVEWGVAEAFVESVKWRDRKAFSDRSLELLNSLHQTNQDPFQLLLEIAVSADHPWNANLIHKNLLARPLAKRDAFWTVWLNDQSDDVETPVGRLIDWCLSGQSSSTNRQNQLLAAIVLCWFFTSSNRGIRDRSTKALTSLLLVREDLFSSLLEKFETVDDLYVTERLLAAGFGACCRDQREPRLMSYCSAIYKHIFVGNQPPFGLLLRDYARGIVELSGKVASLPSDVNVEFCRPPYVSPRVRFHVSEEQLEALAEKSGGKEISDSACSFMGDFAQYEVKPSVGHFLTVHLDKEVPMSKRQKLRIFEDEVVRESKKRILAFEEFERVVNPYSYGLVEYDIGHAPRINRNKKQRWKADVASAEAKFVSLLSDGERLRFAEEAAPALSTNSNGSEAKPRKIDIGAAQRWVANRAYRLGWNAKLFPNDHGHRGGYSRARPMVERIGKKYQWLALDELKCRLADHNWLDGSFDDLPKVYDNPIDIGFERDIDPTILSEKAEPVNFSVAGSQWMASPRIELPNVSERDLSAWPFQEDPASNLQKLVFRTDHYEERWIVLYEHHSLSIKYPDDQTSDHGLRQQEFRFLDCVIVRRSDVKEIVTKVKAEQEIDVSSWSPRDLTDGPFLFEAPWRNTWPNEKWNSDVWRAPKGVDIAFPANSYFWESHLDASLPDGFRTHLPSVWLADQLSSSPDYSATGLWNDKDRQPLFVEAVGNEGGVVFLVRERTFASLLEKEELCCLWLLVAERNVWPGGHNNNAAWRRSEGVCWQQNGRLKVEKWKRDSANGTSRAALPDDEGKAT